MSKADLPLTPGRAYTSRDFAELKKIRDARPKASDMIALARRHGGRYEERPDGKGGHKWRVRYTSHENGKMSRLEREIYEAELPAARLSMERLRGRNPNLPEPGPLRDTKGRRVVPIRSNDEYRRGPTGMVFFRSGDGWRPTGRGHWSQAADNLPLDDVHLDPDGEPWHAPDGEWVRA